MAHVMMLYLGIAWRNRLSENRLTNRIDLQEAIIDGASHQRIRPMLMTWLSIFIGLLPIMLSTSTGEDVMKRIAAPMIGGVASALIMALFVFPALFSIWRGSHLPSNEE